MDRLCWDQVMRMLISGQVRALWKKWKWFVCRWTKHWLYSLAHLFVSCKSFRCLKLTWQTSLDHYNFSRKKKLWRISGILQDLTVRLVKNTEETTKQLLNILITNSDRFRSFKLPLFVVGCVFFFHPLCWAWNLLPSVICVVHLPTSRQWLLEQSWASMGDLLWLGSPNRPRRGLFPPNKSPR